MSDSRAAPLLSVVVPVYNGERYLNALHGAIVSACSGDCSLELIFVDDGSRDGSLALCEKIASYDSRVVCLHQDNKGICSARNAGLDASRGRYVMFSDQDDEPLPDGVNALLSAEAETGADMVIGGKVMMRTEGGGSKVASSLELRYDEALLTDRLSIETLLFNEDGKHRVSHLWNCLYKRELIERFGLRFDTEFRMGFEDTDFNNRYMLHCSSVAFSNRIVYRYHRDSDASTSLRHNPHYIDDMTRLLSNIRYSGAMRILEANEGKAAFNLFALKNYSAAYDHLRAHCGGDRIRIKRLALACASAYRVIAFPDVLPRGFKRTLRGGIYSAAGCVLSKPFGPPLCFGMLNAAKRLAMGRR